MPEILSKVGHTAFGKLREMLKSSSRVATMGATLLSSTIGNLATIIVTAWLVRHLGAEAFGRVAIMSTAATALGNVTASGIALYVVRALSVPQDDNQATVQVSAAALAGQLGAATISLCTIALAAAGVIQLKLSDVLPTAWALHCITADMHAKNALIGQQRVIPLAVATMCGALLAAILQVICTYLNGPDGYLFGFAVGTTAQYFCSHFAYQATQHTASHFNLRRHLDVIRSPEFRRFVIPATISASLVPVAHWAANLIAIGKAGKFQDVAVLTVAMQFFNVVIFIPTVLNKIILPHTIRAYSAGQTIVETRRHTLKLSATFFAISALAPALAWLASEHIQAIYHFQDTRSISVILTFCAAASFACAGIPISNYVVSHEKMLFGLLTNVFWTCCYLLLSWLLPVGALAVGVALFIAYLLTLLLAATPLFAKHSNDRQRT